MYGVRLCFSDAPLLPGGLILNARRRGISIIYRIVASGVLRAELAESARSNYLRFDVLKPIYYVLAAPSRRVK